jgi:hypothetical protein
MINSYYNPDIFISEFIPKIYIHSFLISFFIVKSTNVKNILYDDNTDLLLS